MKERRTRWTRRERERERRKRERGNGQRDRQSGQTVSKKKNKSRLMRRELQVFRSLQCSQPQPRLARLARLAKQQRLLESYRCRLLCRCHNKRVISESERRGRQSWQKLSSSTFLSRAAGNHDEVILGQGSGGSKRERIEDLDLEIDALKRQNEELLAKLTKRKIKVSANEDDETRHARRTPIEKKKKKKKKVLKLEGTKKSKKKAQNSSEGKGLESELDGTEEEAGETGEDVIYVSAEVSPWSKTGGLGDVASSLPVALAERGHRVTVVSPLYKFVKEKWCVQVEGDQGEEEEGEGEEEDKSHLKLRRLNRRDIKLHMDRSGAQNVNYWGTRFPPNAPVDWIFVEHPCYLREGTPYGNEGEAFVDNAFRFSVLALSALELPLQWWSQVEKRDMSKDSILFMANDWHASMVPVYLSCKFQSNYVLSNCRSMLVIHNLMHQGAQDPAFYPMLGLEDEWYDLFDYPANENVFDAPLLPAAEEVLHQRGGSGGFDHYASYDSLDMLEHESLDAATSQPSSQERCANMMVAGIRTCDRIVTVSSTYAWEIVSKNSFGFGFGLQSELLKRRDDVHGIVNGIDIQEWDPETDHHIPHNFGRDDLSGKDKCKACFLRSLDLDDDTSVPLIGFIGRLDRQKGADVLLDALPSLLDTHVCGEKVNVVMLGTGDEQLEVRIRNAQKSFPDHFRGILEFNVKAAHQIIASCDILLMPSRFEPCGLNQLFAQRYGTVPVVHGVGGLSDTVQDFNQLYGSGTGWTFKPNTPSALAETVTFALSVLKNDGDKWSKLMRNCMGSEHSWPIAASQYELLMTWTMQAAIHHKCNKTPLIVSSEA